MPLRNARVLTHRPSTVTDSVDGTNASPGSMMATQDLVPSMHTAGVWVPRPAAFKLFDFSTFTGPIAGELLVEIGSRVYGFVASGRNPGRSEPFIYDFAAGGFVAIQGITAANTPLSLPATGEVTWPTLSQNGAFILFSHPGFQAPNAFGWLDMTGFRDTATGQTGFGATPGVWGSMIWGSGMWGGPQPAGGIGISNLSKNVLIAGWRAGMLITDSAGQIPPGTRIASVAPDGLSLVLTASTSGPSVSGDQLTVMGGTPAAPLWNAGNTSVHALAGPVTALALFNGRAEYAVNTTQNSVTTAAVEFSDAGDPLVRSLPTPEVVTLQNGLAITALVTQPFSNATVIGGIVQALLVFQGDATIWQITGDPATNDLALNYLSPIGTLAAATIQTTPEGTRYVAPDGARLIQLDGTVSEPLSTNGQGVALPFINAQYPSRMVAAYNEDVYRVSVTGETAIGGSPIATIVSAEYWYHLKLKAWSGPHSFPAKLITASARPATNHGFLMFPLTGSLPEVWFSNTRPLIDSRYLENGQQMHWTYQTTLLPDTLADFMNAMVESTLFIGLGPTDAVTVTAIRETGEVLDQVTISGFVPPPGGTQLPQGAAGIWGTMIWGTSLWGAETGGAIPAGRRIPWRKPLVFRQVVIMVTGTSHPNVAIGNLYLRYQQLGYQIADPAQVIGGGIAA